MLSLPTALVHLQTSEKKMEISRASYRPHAKDGEGNVLTGVCLFTGCGGGGTLLTGPWSFLCEGGGGVPRDDEEGNQDYLNWPRVMIAVPNHCSD